MDICVLVGWQRPEFMAVCLEQILKADGNEQLMYYFALDHGYDVRYDSIVAQFPRKKAVLRMPKSEYKLGKQSYNVLNALIAAARNTDKYVFYVEEDIFIGHDFFRMHYAIHKQQPNIFCSVLSRCNNTDWVTLDDKKAYYLSDRADYQCWGNCFDKDKILTHIQPHFVKSYFEEPCGYVNTLWPNSIIGRSFCEQDGLTRRIVEQLEALVAFPHVPRAFHAGYYGYNRPNNRPASYDERLRAVKRICFDPILMKQHCKPGYFKDSQPVAMDTNESSFYFKNATL